MKYVFIRNDDVGANHDPCTNKNACKTVPESLKNMTEICAQNNVPITLGVVPNMLNDQHIKWIKGVMKTYPDIVEICQHGYTHEDHGCKEFGSCRTHEQQLSDIEKGMKLMDEKLGFISKTFIPPNNRYTPDTLSALKQLRFEIISAKYRKKGIHGAINKISDTIGTNGLLGLPASKHMQSRNGIKEISISIDFSSSYDPVKNKTAEQIINELESYENEKVVGIMFHHWTFENNDLKIFQSIIEQLKLAGYKFKKLEEISKMI